MIKCSTCKLEKPDDDFHKSRRTKNGRANACKKCMIEYKRRWWDSGGREKDKEYAKKNSAVAVARMTKWKKMYPERRLWHSAKRRALMSGKDFSIDWMEIVIPSVCPVLGIPINLNGGPITANSPSLDRLDNSKGYVPGNVQVTSHRANALKSNLTLEQAERLLIYMKRYRK